MAIKFIGDAEPNPRHNEWRFRVLRTQPRSKVSEFFDAPLSYEVVEQIYRKTIGEVPATGLERRNDFAGNTPSTLNIPAGKHLVTVRKAGFQEWVQTLNVYGGSITLNAELTRGTDESHAAKLPTPLSSDKESVAESSATSSPKPVGWLGIHAQNSGDGAVVTNVSADGPGAQAGIQVGDMILALDGRLIKGRDFETAVAAPEPGTQISVNYARGSAAHEVSVTVGSQN